MKSKSPLEHIGKLAVVVVVGWFVLFHTQIGGRVVVLGLDLMGRQPTPEQRALAGEPPLPELKMPKLIGTYQTPDNPLHLNHDQLLGEVSKFVNTSNAPAKQN